MDWSPFNNSFSIGWSVCAASGRGQKFAPSCGLALLSGWLTEFLHNGASAVKDNVGVIRTRCGFPCRQPSNASPRNWKIARTHSKKKSRWTREDSPFKPWPNGPPSSGQLEPSSQLRWSWVSFGCPLGLNVLELAWIWSSSNFRPTRAKISTVWPPQPTQACSRQVVWLLLRDYAVVFRQLNGFLQAASN